MQAGDKPLPWFVWRLSWGVCRGSKIFSITANGVVSVNVSYEKKLNAIPLTVRAIL